MAGKVGPLLSRNLVMSHDASVATTHPGAQHVGGLHPWGRHLCWKPPINSPLTSTPTLHSGPASPF